MKESKLYCCYSIPLRNYLTQNGMRYEICAKNSNSDILMWVFIDYLENQNMESEV